MNVKMIYIMSVLSILFLTSGCINIENIVQEENSVNNKNADTNVITIEDWDKRSAIVDSEGNLIYKRDGAYYSRNLVTNEEKHVSEEFAVGIDGTEPIGNIFVQELSRNITVVNCQIYKHISYYGDGIAEVTDEKTGCLSIDGKKVAFLADDKGGYNKGVYKSLYYYDLESKKAHKLMSEGRIVEIVGWTNNDEIIFFEGMRDVDFKSPVTSKLFYFNITENQKYSIAGTESDWSFSVSPDGTKVLLIGVNTRIYDFLKKSATPVVIGVWSDSSKKFASLTDKSLILFNTEDGSKKTIDYNARENHMQRLVWHKDKVYIIVFAPLVSNSYESGDTDYGTVIATFNGKNPTVRYLDMKPDDIADIQVTVTSKINSSSVIVTLIEPHTNAYTILEGPSKMGKYIYNNSVSAGWSETYIWKVSPDGTETDVYAPIDIEVEFSNHKDRSMINDREFRRNVYFTIANPYIVNK